MRFPSMEGRMAVPQGLGLDDGVTFDEKIVEQLYFNGQLTLEDLRARYHIFSIEQLREKGFNNQELAHLAAHELVYNEQAEAISPESIGSPQKPWTLSPDVSTIAGMTFRDTLSLLDIPVEDDEEPYFLVAGPKDIQ